MKAQPCVYITRPTLGRGVTRALRDGQPATRAPESCHTHTGRTRAVCERHIITVQCTKLRFIEIATGNPAGTRGLFNISLLIPPIRAHLLIYPLFTTQLISDPRPLFNKPASDFLLLPQRDFQIIFHRSVQAILYDSLTTLTTTFCISSVWGTLLTKQSLLGLDRLFTSLLVAVFTSALLGEISAKVRESNPGLSTNKSKCHPNFRVCVSFSSQRNLSQFAGKPEKKKTYAGSRIKIYSVRNPMKWVSNARKD